MPHPVSLLAALAFTASVLYAADPPQLFNKAKEQFRLGSYAACLRTLDDLDSETQKLELEAHRAALLPALLFYRGASYAALGRKSEARSEFQLFLAYQPDASLDPGRYPKKVIAAFEETREALLQKNEQARKGQGTSEGSPGSIAQAYRAFKTSFPEEEGSLGEEWAGGPVRFLLTAEERRDYARLLDPVSRSEFVVSFWKSRDPKSETAENEFRQEFEKRIAFADARFTQDEVRGSLTDRGMVFILLGPPTYVGRKPLTAGEDANDSSALFRYRRSDVQVAAMPGGSGAQQVARVDLVTGPGTRVNEAAQNWREVWHYRKEHLPRDVPYLQVDFDFVTKQGYGVSVLQRDTQVLDTLERAKTRMKQAKV